MSRVFLTMAMSLDGFITGPQDDAQNPAGIDGMRLMDWLGGGGGGDEGDRVEGYRPTDPNSRMVFDEALATGAVITGKRTGLRRLLGRRPPRRSTDLRPHPSAA
jgi:hypothetical protein